MAETFLVVGLGLTGEAVARQLRLRGGEVVVVEDRPSPAIRARAEILDVELVEAPGPAELARLVARSATVVPSPGVPHAHPVHALAAAAGVPVRGEVELAWRWTPRPIVAVTGTNGKTSVTTLVAEMLDRSGVPAVAAGNIGRPLADAVVDEAARVIVAELSSFQLEHTRTFRPRVAAWLNLAPDHLDWHPSFEHYASAKAKVWAHQGAGDVAVGNANDAVVSAALARAPAERAVTFGLGRADVWWDRSTGRPGGVLRAGGEEIVAVAALNRALPHDLANALAASAVALAAGASLEGCRRALEEFRGLPHRVQLVGEAGGVRFVDDSKSTTPASVLAAVAGFGSVVLLAGGRNKGLDLGVLAQAAPRLRAVVALGEAAGEVEAAFAGLCPVTAASSMAEAVANARVLARPGDAVLLSPGCASFDWYGSYAERGDDFARCVREQTGEGTRAGDGGAGGGR